MGYTRQAIVLDVVFGGVLAQGLAGVAAQNGHGLQFTLELEHRFFSDGQQFANLGTSVIRVDFHSSFLDFDPAGINFAQAVRQGFNQGRQALGVVQQVVLQIRVAAYHPDIAQHLEQHAC